jgi:hypothetical protein
MIGIATCPPFSSSAQEMEDAFSSHCCFTPTQLQLVGAYFLHEYSFEAAALFNPSIVPHPNQSGVAPGAIRFILSLRAVGEGHISSLTFRCGTFLADGTLMIEPPTRLASLPRVTMRVGDKLDLAFEADSDITERVIFPLPRRRPMASRMPASYPSSRKGRRPITRPTRPTAVRRSDRNSSRPAIS